MILLLQLKKCNFLSWLFITHHLYFDELGWISLSKFHSSVYFKNWLNLSEVCDLRILIHQHCYVALEQHFVLTTNVVNLNCIPPTEIELFKVSGWHWSSCDVHVVDLYMLYKTMIHTYGTPTDRVNPPLTILQTELLGTNIPPFSEANNNVL